MTHVALRFAYDGSLFDSYALQPGRRTVEQTLLACLVKANVIPGRRRSRFRTGSRTDAGVSAAQNVCAFDSRIPARRLASVVQPPDGLWVLAAADVPTDFDPRRARLRTYLHVAPDSADISLPRLRAGLRSFVGTHDFSAFARVEPSRDALRTVFSTSARRVDGRIECRVRGQSFLWFQVRRMIGAAYAVASDRLALEQVETRLADPGLGPPPGIRPAAASGLLLERVRYPGLRWHASDRSVGPLVVRARVAALLSEATRIK